MELPLASAVIPTFNRPALLLEAVRSVLAQATSVSFELLVVDDGGTQRAVDTLSNIHDARLRIITVKNGGPAAARNHGLRAARGEYVAFMDDDCTANAGWLQAAVDAFSDGVVMVQGPVAPPRPASPLEFHFIQTGSHRHDFSCNMVVRRTVALSIGGFDEGFPAAAGEDFDFCYRMEPLGEIRFSEGAAITHALVPITWKKRRSRPRMWESYLRLAGLHPDRVLPQMMIPLVEKLFPGVGSSVPPVRAVASLALMQFAYLRQAAGHTTSLVTAGEAAACVANAAEAAAYAPRYLAAYLRATEERRERVRARGHT